ncbi:nitrogenase component 1 [Clostridium lundense]|uniref:nitrogenase component 1 n=1 Tax=Clostridium lundense TaxID=319475 RepID=UPI000481CB10|nr:nitrogenase component 1 [Clostridium lundense]
MNKLFQFIPPFASDYSGICSVLMQLEDCLNILITPKGCIKTILEIDNVDKLEDTNLYYTTLTQKHVISGFDESIICSILEIFENNPKKCINIINTPVPSIIGSNLKGIADILEKKLKVPVILFDSTGFENYSFGISEALLNIGKKFINTNITKKSNSVNILGYSSLIIGNKLNLYNIEELIKNCGIEIISTWCNETTIEKFKYASDASLNIVISAEGIPLAEYMKDKFNIPYIIDIPIGVAGTIKFLNSIENMLNIKVKFPICKINRISSDKKVLIIGNPVENLAIRYCLNKDFALKEIKTISLISSSRKEKRLYKYSIFSDINFVYSEYELAKIMKKFDFDILISDPLYYDLINKQATIIPIPHIGLSGGEFIKDSTNYIFKNGFKYFYKYLLQ